MRSRALASGSAEAVDSAGRESARRSRRDEAPGELSETRLNDAEGPVERQSFPMLLHESA